MVVVSVLWVKNLIFWSIHKGTYNLSGNGSERELVTHGAISGCLQLDFRPGAEDFSLVDLELLILKRKSYDMKDTLSCFPYSWMEEK